MKFVISSAALFNRLQSISRVINSKNTLPILDCFLFEFQNNVLTITASDSETTLITFLDVIECDCDARFCINAKTIQDSMKEIAEQPMTFDVNLDDMEITANYQNGRFCIVGQNADEYPKFQVSDEEMSSVLLPSDDFLSGISHCIFATGNDEIRQVMNGIYFDIYPDGIVFVATDGRKLVRIKNTAIRNNEHASFILPQKPATLLKNLLPKESNDVTLSFNSKNAIVNMESTKLICRLIEGRYPNYNSVIPTQNPYRVTIDRQSFISTIKRILIFSSQSSALIKLHLSENQIIVSGQDLDYSTSAEEKLACEYQGNEINIGFSGTFLLDILNNMVGENVMIELADPSRAGVLVPVEQNENEDMLMLLMPMMLND